MQGILSDPLFLLRLGPAIIMFLFGLDQFMNPNRWLSFMPSWVPEKTGIDPITLMRLHSVVNIVLGILLMTYSNIIVAGLAFFWFLSILPFAYSADWTIGLRDTAVILSLLALIDLLRHK